MSRVYLINVGSNTADAPRARSPRFRNDSFIYVPFCTKKGRGLQEFPKTARPYIQNIEGRGTHCDPDWKGLTYGDDCRNPRARVLRKVVEDDILLFWSLLWSNGGNSWTSFAAKRSWCLIGALRVREILEPGQRAEDVKSTRFVRAKRNVHFYNDKLDPGNYVFIGCTKHSRLFPKAVDLQISDAKGLLYRTVRTAHGSRLTLDGNPQWYTSIRNCRAVWNLDERTDRARAKIVRDAIFRKTGYDLLKGL